MVLLLEDLLNSVWTIWTKAFNPTQSFPMKLKARNSLISHKFVTLLSSLLIKFAVKARTFLINLLFCKFSLTLAPIWRWLIYPVSLVSRLLTSPKILRKLRERWLTDMCQTPGPSFCVLCQRTRIWPRLMVYRWRVTSTQKVSVQSVWSQRSILWTVVPTQKRWSWTKKYSFVSATSASKTELRKISWTKSQLKKLSRKNKLSSNPTQFTAQCLQTLLVATF